LLERPYTVSDAFLAPAERLDVLLDLRDARPGDALTLASLPFDPMHHEEGTPGPAGAGEHAHHGAHGGASGQNPYTPDGAEIDLMRIHISRKIAYDRTVPQSLSRVEPAASVQAKPRIITLDQSKGIWRINGLTYEGGKTPIVVKRGATEVWEIRNASRSMPHPMHVHGFQFRVTSREGSPEQVRRLALDERGLTASDLGWKDTVLSWPGETVRIVTDFTHPFPGDQVYMVHCHNLEHEDGGMMLNLKVAT
jgi:suppressor of ftsI/bilirubin oxidase